jgi:hypothetical protein
VIALTILFPGYNDGNQALLSGLEGRDRDCRLESRRDHLSHGAKSGFPIVSFRVRVSFRVKGRSTTRRRAGEIWRGRSAESTVRWMIVGVRMPLMCYSEGNTRTRIEITFRCSSKKKVLHLLSKSGITL